MGRADDDVSSQITTDGFSDENIKPAEGSTGFEGIRAATLRPPLSNRMPLVNYQARKWVVVVPVLWPLFSMYFAVAA